MKADKAQTETLKVSLMAFAAAFAISSASSLAQAEEAGESSTTVDEVSPKNAEVKAQDGSDADDVITNRRLRAETGSKNKYSFSASLAYDGGTVKNPFAEVRPNITSSAGQQIDPSLGGSVSMRYRVSPTSNISASTGVGVDKPFHADKTKSFGQRSYVIDPSVDFTTIYKTGAVQNVTTVAATLYTTAHHRKNGYRTAFDLSQTFVYDFGGSKFSVGTSLSATYNVFDKSDAALRPEQVDIRVGAYPFVEYVINDTLNFRTLVGFMFDHGRGAAFGDWTPNTIYQSAGLGISVTRDIYLYPNVQFTPEDARLDNTNVGLSAIINL
jgi:hypothetical protein